MVVQRVVGGVAGAVVVVVNVWPESSVVAEQIVVVILIDFVAVAATVAQVVLAQVVPTTISLEASTGFRVRVASTERISLF